MSTAVALRHYDQKYLIEVDMLIYRYLFGSADNMHTSYTPEFEKSIIDAWNEEIPSSRLFSESQDMIDDLLS